MRHLQTYKIFEAAQSLTSEQQAFLDEYTEGTWTLNPSTGEVDVDGDFDCSNMGYLPLDYEDLTDFKGISFGTVTGDFDCSGCTSLETLEGAPTKVEGDFDCRNCTSLKTLEGAPTKVEGYFYCGGCTSLKTLEGAPTEVEGDFSCRDCTSLKTLEGAPTKVEGDFYCGSCTSLKTLEGAPETIGGKFYSDGLEIPEGKWSIETLIRLLTTGSQKEKQMVGPLVDPGILQQKIDQNPENMLVKLKDHLKHPHFRGLKWPEHLEGEKDLLSDLSDVGL